MGAGKRRGTVRVWVGVPYLGRYAAKLLVPKKVVAGWHIYWIEEKGKERIGKV